MSSSDGPSFRVGYALPPGKVGTAITPSLISHALERGVELIPVDHEKPLMDQGPFDCLIHKFRTQEWNTQLLDFQSRHPDTVIVDHPKSIEPLKNRITMLEIVPKLGLDNVLLVPNQVLVSGEDEEEEDDDLTARVKLPLIAKPLYADGSLSSHEMCLVLNAEGLKEVVGKQAPVVLQEFANHGGVVFKVYVAGRHVKCVKRKSLPDITADDETSWGDILPFSHISSVTEKEQGTDGLLFGGGVNVARLVEEAQLPPASFVTQVAEGLCKGLGLNLFNFDMIRDDGGSCGGDDDDDDDDDGVRYLLIDINYFPGYAKVPGFEAMLTDFLLDVARAKSGGEANLPRTC